MANRPSSRPHDGWQDMAKPFIAAYKAGAKSVTSYIKTDQIIYWYRPTLKSASCDSTDNTMKSISNPSENFFPGRPNGADSMSDAIFVVALLQQAGTVKVSSGGNSKTFNGQAGANVWAVNMGVGKQSFSLSRGGNTVLSGTSLKDISANCICGIYNFNAYVGTLPPGKPDPLHPDGFGGFTKGLAPGICQPTPSLGTAAAAAAVATASTGTQNPAPVPTSSDAVMTPDTDSSTTPPGFLTTTPVPQSTAIAPTTTTAPIAGSNTITALSQLFPTNCMQAGQVWAGPAGSDPPARCDG
ncbi:MAG: hypothetical protein LQ350_002682 [Teloschistes chrysophthalmus]|nr:MAG: hypothetical protein LQ350_002682 [Niorma chrysophthalma]